MPASLLSFDGFQSIGFILSSIFFEPPSLVLRKTVHKIATPPSEAPITMRIVVIVLFLTAVADCCSGTFVAAASFRVWLLKIVLVT